MIRSNFVRVNQLPVVGGRRVRLFTKMREDLFRTRRRGGEEHFASKEVPMRRELSEEEVSRLSGIPLPQLSEYGIDHDRKIFNPEVLMERALQGGLGEVAVRQRDLAVGIPLAVAQTLAVIGRIGDEEAVLDWPHLDLSLSRYASDIGVARAIAVADLQLGLADSLHSDMIRREGERLGAVYRSTGSSLRAAGWDLREFSEDVANDLFPEEERLREIFLRGIRRGEAESFHRAD